MGNPGVDHIALAQQAPVGDVIASSILSTAP
jgi:hypothetical protein